MANANTSAAAALVPSAVVTVPAKLFSLFNAAPISASAFSVSGGVPPMMADSWALKYAAVVFSAASDDTAATDVVIAVIAVCMAAADADRTDETDVTATARFTFSAEMPVLIKL